MRATTSPSRRRCRSTSRSCPSCRRPPSARSSSPTCAAARSRASSTRRWPRRGAARGWRRWSRTAGSGLVAELAPGPEGRDDAAVARGARPVHRAVALAGAERGGDAAVIRGFAHRRRPPAAGAGPARAPRTRVVWFDLFAPTHGGGDAARAGDRHRRADPRRDGGDRGFEPALPRERRRLHDRDPAGEGRHRSSGAGAGHLHPGGRRAWSPSATTRPRAFESFPERAERLDLGCIDGKSVLLALLEAIVERLADILEAVGPGRRGAVAGDLPPRCRAARTRRRTTARCCRAWAGRET